MTPQFHEYAYLVEYHAANDLTANLRQVFMDRWRAEAFVAGCSENLRARVVALYRPEPDHVIAPERSHA